MSCGLSAGGLFILDVMYRGRNLALAAGLHSKKLKKLFNKKFSRTEKFESVIRILLNDGYITQIPKKEMKYYISNRKIAVYALGSHDYSVVRGKQRPL